VHGAADCSTTGSLSGVIDVFHNNKGEIDIRLVAAMRRH
jgi:hypothetical protein